MLYVHHKHYQNSISWARCVVFDDDLLCFPRDRGDRPLVNLRDAEKTAYCEERLKDSFYILNQKWISEFSNTGFELPSPTSLTIVSPVSDRSI